MPELAETYIPPKDGSGYDVNLRTEPRKFLHTEGDEPLSGYVIQRGVGVGGFGEVYYAISQAGKDVALKRVHRNLDIELRGVRQCLNLRHPNLVELYDIRYDARKAPWVVMEFIGGDSLRDVIRRNPRGLSDTVVRHWFKGVAAGVAYLHDNDVVHRDIKPGNLFLDNGIVKIGDYGLAKMISTSHGSGQTESVGTFHYMAPEIGLGKYGRRIDIYALGILLYEMLTGHVPFDGESSQEIIMKHLTTEPDLDAIAEPYRSVVARALEKDPDRRYSTVDGMLADLDLTASYYEVGEPDSAKSSPSPVDGEADVVMASTADPAEKPRRVVTAEAVPHPGASSLSNEPIARGLHLLLNKLRASWESASFNTPTKFLLLLISVLLFVVNSAWIVPTVFFLGTIYAGYLMIWMLLSPVPVDTSVAKPANVSASPAPPQLPAVQDGQRALQPNLTCGTPRLSREIFRNRALTDRLRELVGSMLLSTLVVGVLSVLMLVVGSDGMGQSPYHWAPTLAWMGLTSLIGTWIVLVHGKLFEAGEGDPVLRRFSMLVAGMVLGAIATGLASWLYFEPTYLLKFRPTFLEYRPTIWGSSLLYQIDGTPQLLAAMGYFGGLMLTLRWWRLADPLRTTRLSMLTTVGCVLSAILIYFVMPYPHGFLIAATMSMAIQISAPWLNRRQRRQLVEAGAPLTNEV